MRQIRVGKVTVNIGVGEPGDKLENMSRLLNQITNSKPVKTTTKRRIPEWDIRPGLQIGVKTTLRGKEADEFLRRALVAVENKISKAKFDKYGNFSFGVGEYVHIPGVKYDYSVGMAGLSVAVTLYRAGFSIAKRRSKAKIGKSHLISKEDAIEFIKEKYKVNII